MTVDQRLAVRIPVVCMWDDHGSLVAYQTMDGTIAVQPCEECLADAVERKDEHWRAAIADVLGSRHPVEVEGQR